MKIISNRDVSYFTLALRSGRYCSLTGLFPFRLSPRKGRPTIILRLVLIGHDEQSNYQGIGLGGGRCNTGGLSLCDQLDRAGISRILGHRGRPEVAFSGPRGPLLTQLGHQPR
jgi:hypothetical protein